MASSYLLHLLSSTAIARDVIAFLQPQAMTASISFPLSSAVTAFPHSAASIWRNIVCVFPERLAVTEVQYAAEWIGARPTTWCRYWFASLRCGIPSLATFPSFPSFFVAAPCKKLCLWTQELLYLGMRPWNRAPPRMASPETARPRGCVGAGAQGGRCGRRTRKEPTAIGLG